MPPKDSALSVSQITREIRSSLSERFQGGVWVRGEIGDISRPPSGHIYLTLKDDQAQLKGVIWRMQARQIPWELGNGDEVFCFGELDVYPPRGAYQLVVRRIEAAGEGARQRALKQLQARLQKEGLFAAWRKRSLPRFPRRVAVVTSPSGAAIRDFLEVVRRRWQGIQIVVVPTRVQGPAAAPEIAAAIQIVERIRPPLDVMVVGRGGGSQEDLWCFHDERVVRAIAETTIPVVSAVGHEIDVTLADLAADVRALTPTEAAERVVPSRQSMLGELDQYRQRLGVSMSGCLTRRRERLDRLSQRPVLKEPQARIHELQRRLDDTSQRLDRAAGTQVRHHRERLGHLASRLDSLSPLQVLTRGYSVTQHEDQRVVRSADQVEVGELLRTRLHSGDVYSRVERVDKVG